MRNTFATLQVSTINFTQTEWLIILISIDTTNMLHKLNSQRNHPGYNYKWSIKMDNIIEST